AASAMLATKPAGGAERTDAFGEPLPAGAVARFGTFRLRNRIDWVVFSPDGKTLAADGTSGIRLWDAATGKPLPQFRDHPDPLRHVAFSPDGKTVASWGKDRTIRLWDLVTGKALGQLGGRQDQEEVLAFAPDGKILVSESWDPADTNHTLRV